MLVTFLWISLPSYYCLQHINPAMYNTVRKEACFQKIHLHVPKWLQEKKKEERRPHSPPIQCFNWLCKCTYEWRHHRQPMGSVIRETACKMKMWDPSSSIAKNFKVTQQRDTKRGALETSPGCKPPPAHSHSPGVSVGPPCQRAPRTYRGLLHPEHTFLFVSC